MLSQPVYIHYFSGGESPNTKHQKKCKKDKKKKKDKEGKSPEKKSSVYSAVRRYHEDKNYMALTRYLQTSSWNKWDVFFKTYNCIIHSLKLKALIWLFVKIMDEELVIFN